jgi:fumarate hydratase class II
MAVIKQAAALVNMELGLLDRQRGQAVVQAAQEVLNGRWNDQFVVDPFQAGAGTSHNMNVNEVIANRANQILGYRLDDAHKAVQRMTTNMSQSTNTRSRPIRLGCLWRLTN